MYHSMRKSMAAARKHAFVRNACGHYLDGSRARTAVLVIIRSHEKCYKPLVPSRTSSQPFMGHGASHRQLGRRSRFCACSARRCGKVWRRIATTRSSDRRAWHTTRRCDRRSHSLPRPRARHARRSRRCGLRARHRERRLRFSPWRSAETAAALRRAETCTSPQDSAPGAGGETRFRDQPVKLPAVLGGFG